MSDEKISTEFPDQAQRAAVCSGLWDERKGEVMSGSQQLLEAIRGRTVKQTEFSYGILTADRWVRTLQDLAGVDACYTVASQGMTSFNDVLQKASLTLTYSNADMVVEEKAVALPDDVVLPKNTLMVFKHVLTTPRKDRDGDILRTQGAVVDPKMLLLWQHIPTLPIGKMLSVVEHNEKRLVLVSCIVDMNEVSHDAAVMVDNDMARFSHGFRALEFEQIKEQEGGPGFDIKQFEVMEESIVSVPSNADAEQQEVLLSLVEGGKLTSSLMKEVGKSLRGMRNVQVPVAIEVAELPEEGLCDETETKDEIVEDPGSGTGPSEEAEAVAEEAVTEERAEDKEVTEPEQVVVPELEEKAGRVLSASNLGLLEECVEDVEELIGKANSAYSMSRGAVAVCERILRKLREVIDSARTNDSEATEPVPKAVSDVREAIGVIISAATTHQREKLIYILKTLQHNEEQQRKAEQFRAIRSKS